MTDRSGYDEYEPVINLRDTVRVFRKRRKLIGAIFLLAVIIGGLCNIFIPPTYEAITLLMVDIPTENPAVAQQIISTYTEILKSHSVLDSVIHKVYRGKSKPPTYREMLYLITTQPVKDTGILKIRVRANSLKKAQILGNALMDTFTKRLTLLFVTMPARGQVINGTLFTTNIRLIDKAVSPQKPVAPNKLLNFLVAGLFGLFFALGMALSLEYLNHPADVEYYLELPVLGMIPVYQTTVSNVNFWSHLYRSVISGSIKIGKGILLWERNSRKTAQENYHLVIQEQAGPQMIQAYRETRKKFNFFNMNGNLKTFLITGAKSDAGTSVTAANIAITLAQSGEKVIIVDCNIHQPLQHKIFDCGGPGLVDALLDENALPDLIRETTVKNLALLTYGTKPPNPAELFDSPGMRNLLAQLKSNYDFLILDAPPVTAFPETRILASQADGVILVMATESVRPETGKKAKEWIIKTKGRILGVILNKERDSSDFFEMLFF